MATLGDPDRGRRPAAPRAQQEQQRERRSQQGNQEGPQSSPGLDGEPGRPTDKAAAGGLPDRGHPAAEDGARHSSAASRDDEDDGPVNTGGKPGPANTD